MFSSLSARSKVGETRDLNWVRNTLQLQPFVTPDKVRAKPIELRLGFSWVERENNRQSRGSTSKLHHISPGFSDLNCVKIAIALRRPISLI